MTAPTPSEALHAAVAARAAQVQAAYDGACAGALQRGCGVLVVLDGPGVLPVSIRPDKRVPPGMIWEAPSEEAVRLLGLHQRRERRRERERS